MLDFAVKLIAVDGFEDKKFFDTQAAALKWICGEGSAAFDGDLHRAEIHHKTDGLIWVHLAKPDHDAFSNRMINRNVGRTGKQLFREGK